MTSFVDLSWTYVLVRDEICLPSTQLELRISYYCFRSMSHPIRGELIQIIPTWEKTYMVSDYTTFGGLIYHDINARQTTIDKLAS